MTQPIKITVEGVLSPQAACEFGQKLYTEALAEGMVTPEQRMAFLTGVAYATSEFGAIHHAPRIPGAVRTDLLELQPEAGQYD